MAHFGFHASHEELAPGALLDAVRSAEGAGFELGMCSDHFAPWSNSQGHSGFAWAWLGAALAATDSMPFGVVTAPGQRYHPKKAERNARLSESVEVMRALFAGETVSHDGRVRVDRARLYSLPEEPPPIFAAAVTPHTARWAGGWADGLITINRPPEQLEEVVEAFREGGGEGKPLRLQVHLSYNPDEDEALRVAHEQWRYNILGSDVAWDLEMPEDFEQVAAYIRPEDVHPSVLVSSDLARYADWLGGLVELGFEEIYLHQVGGDQRGFVEAFGEEVLPALAKGGV